MISDCGSQLKVVCSVCAGRIELQVIGGSGQELCVVMVNQELRGNGQCWKPWICSSLDFSSVKSWGSRVGVANFELRRLPVQI